MDVTGLSVTMGNPGIPPWPYYLFLCLDPLPHIAVKAAEQEFSLENRALERECLQNIIQD